MHRQLVKRIALVVSMLALASPAPAGESATHPFSVHDMLAVDRISDPQLSPDGSRLAFVRRTTDLEANRGRTDLWLVGLDGEGLRRLTSHPAGDHDPRWAPDGRSLWFLSSRSGSSQVWRIPVDGGEAVQATDLPLDVGSLAVSPDGTRLAVALEVFPDCASLACTEEKLEEAASRRHSARVYEGLFIRHWDSWKDGRRSHLFVLPAAGGAPVDVMKGMDADCPSKPFGGPEEYTFGEVLGVALGPEGTVFVADNQVPVIRQYGPEGTWLGDIGRQGEGPGEYKAIGGLRTPGGSTASSRRSPALPNRRRRPRWCHMPHHGCQGPEDRTRRKSTHNSCRC